MNDHVKGVREMYFFRRKEVYSKVIYSQDEIIVLISYDQFSGLMSVISLPPYLLREFLTVEGIKLSLSLKFKAISYVHFHEKRISTILFPNV